MGCSQRRHQPKAVLRGLWTRPPTTLMSQEEAKPRLRRTRTRSPEEAARVEGLCILMRWVKTVTRMASSAQCNLCHEAEHGYECGRRSREASSGCCCATFIDSGISEDDTSHPGLMHSNSEEGDDDRWDNASDTDTARDCGCRFDRRKRITCRRRALETHAAKTLPSSWATTKARGSNRFW